MITAPENYGGELPAVYNSAQHLRDLIDDVLDLARIDAQKFALSREKVAISALAQEALNMTTRAMSPPKASTCRPKSIGRREEMTGTPYIASARLTSIAAWRCEAQSLPLGANCAPIKQSRSSQAGFLCDGCRIARRFDYGLQNPPGSSRRCRQVGETQQVSLAFHTGLMRQVRQSLQDASCRLRYTRFNVRAKCLSKRPDIGGFDHHDPDRFVWRHPRAQGSEQMKGRR